MCLNFLEILPHETCAAPLKQREQSGGRLYFVHSLLLCCQVINIINAAQESSPVTVAEALERVLEILRTTELYSPQLASKEDDPHTNDLVGGLMNVRHRYCLTPQSPTLSLEVTGQLSVVVFLAASTLCPKVPGSPIL